MLVALFTLLSAFYIEPLFLQLSELVLIDTA